MSAEENKDIVRREVEELYNSDGNLDVADQIYASGYVLYDPSVPGGELRGPEAAKQIAADYRSAFPDLHTTFDEAIAEGDKVAYRWTASGTHEGELMGTPPTGNRMTLTGIAISRISGGKIEECWQNLDALGMMQQLGLMDEPAG
jgi:steroid delta-isomerase-like uncharacterized protein